MSTTADVLLVRLETFEARLALSAVVTGLAQMSSFNVEPTVVFLPELFLAILALEPQVFVDNSQVSSEVFPRLEGLLTLHTVVGSLVHVDN